MVVLALVDMTLVLPANADGSGRTFTDGITDVNWNWRSAIHNAGLRVFACRPFVLAHFTHPPPSTPPLLPPAFPPARALFYAVRWPCPRRTRVHRTGVHYPGKPATTDSLPLLARTDVYPVCGHLSAPLFIYSIRANHGHDFRTTFGF